jgi:hypothetical protein
VWDAGRKHDGQAVPCCIGLHFKLSTNTHNLKTNKLEKNALLSLHKAQKSTEISMTLTSLIFALSILVYSRSRNAMRKNLSI